MLRDAAQLGERQLGVLGDIALPCQPSWSSIFEKPLPLIVFATTTVGLPVVRSASS